MIKLKFVRNKAVLKITNKIHETVTFGKIEMMGIIDLRWLMLLPYVADVFATY